MHYSNFALLLAAALPLASAAPTDGPASVEVRDDGAFTINLVDSGRPRLPGLKSLAKSQRRYNNGTVSEDVAAAQQGTVSATPPNSAFDNEYLSPVTLGGKTLMLDIDTGSSDLWAFSSLQSAADRGQHAYYQASPAKRLQGESWMITYGDNSMAGGYVYADKVVVGGVTATRQAVEAATSVSSDFTQDMNNVGIFGFAFSSINAVRPDKQKTWFDNVKATLPQPIFAAALKKGAPGAYNIGFIDKSRYTGSITYRPIFTANGFWQFLTGGYYVGNKKYGNGPLSFEVIADTGTSLMLLQLQDVKNYYANVPGASFNNQQGGYVFPCNTQLPSWSLIVNGQKRTVPGSYINYARISATQCFGGIQYVGANFPLNILGDIFLKSQYVVFDTRGPRIGIAQGAGT